MPAPLLTTYSPFMLPEGATAAAAAATPAHPAKAITNRPASSGLSAVLASILRSHQATCALPLRFLSHPLRVWRRAGGVRGREMLRAARLSSSSLRRRFCAKASSLGQAQALRPFLVEQYRGWTDPGVEFPSLSSSECEPLSLRQARPARPLAARRRHPQSSPVPSPISSRTLTHSLTRTLTHTRSCWRWRTTARCGSGSHSRSAIRRSTRAASGYARRSLRSTPLMTSVRHLTPNEYTPTSLL